MTIVDTHRGPISGITHVHLLRESAAERAARAAAARQSDELDSSKKGGAGDKPTAAERDSKKRASGR